ncbi:MAG: hypothetical protein ACREAB_17130 [Blastocatellia bacterium]
MFSAKRALLWGAVIMLALTSHQDVCAQSEEPKMDVGAHITLLHHNGSAYIFPFRSDPQGERLQNDVGLGGRISYFAMKHLALEGEINHFPRELQTSGSRTQYLFGPRAGIRFDKVGIFAKARPGFMRFSEGRKPVSDLPGGFGIFRGKNVFAFDFGGVVEFYQSNRFFTRVDLGDTLIRNTDRETVNGGPIRSVSEINHNFQLSLGFGMRF